MNPTPDTGADPVIDLTATNDASADPVFGSPAPATVPASLSVMSAPDQDQTGELVIDASVREQIRTSHHPSAGGREDRCDPSRSRFAPFSECPHCGGEMAAEHAHFRCGGCGWRDSCCD